MKKAAKILGILLILALLAGGGATAYILYLAPRTAQTVEAQAPSDYQTSPVTRGDISRMATGSGSLVASQTAALGFGASGTIAELDVQVGDAVKAGQVLAVLDSIPDLEQAVADAELALIQAQKTVDDLHNGATAALAQALADQASAEEALAAAKNGLHDPHDWRCPDTITAKYYEEYLGTLIGARPWQERLATDDDSDKQYALMNLKPILKKMKLAYLNYQYCLAYTPQEIAQSQADLQSAQAQLQLTQQAYQSLQANAGVDPLELAIAQASLKNAQVQLDSARVSLEGATLHAPFDGKITALSAALGDSAGSQAILTIAQVEPMQLLASVDETDLTNVGSGCPVSASFTALPGQTIAGVVSLIYPSLVSTNSVKGVQVLIDLESGSALPIGAGATVQITCASAQNALLAPVQGIYYDRSGASYVYVLDAQDRPEKRAVEVGIQTSLAAEIISGLQAGEKVITSEVDLP